PRHRAAAAAPHAGVAPRAHHAALAAVAGVIEHVGADLAGGAEAAVRGRAVARQRRAAAAAAVHAWRARRADDAAVPAVHRIGDHVGAERALRSGAGLRLAGRTVHPAAAAAHPALADG